MPWTCGNCETSNPSTASNCDVCGLTRAEALSWFCPDCNRLNAGPDRKCNQCGFDKQRADLPAPVQAPDSGNWVMRLSERTPRWKVPGIFEVEKTEMLARTETKSKTVMVTAWDDEKGRRPALYRAIALVSGSLFVGFVGYGNLLTGLGVLIAFWFVALVSMALLGLVRWDRVKYEKVIPGEKRMLKKVVKRYETGHSTAPVHAGFSQDSALVISVDARGQVIYWDTETATPKVKFMLSEVNPKAIVPGGAGAVEIQFDRVIQYDAEGERIRQIACKGLAPGEAFALSYDSAALATRVGSAGIHIWDLTEGETETKILPVSGPVRKMAFANLGMALAVEAVSGRVKVYDVSDGTELADYANLKPEPIAWCCAPNRPLIAFCYRDGKLAVHDFNEGRVIGEDFAGDGNHFTFAAFHPSGTLLSHIDQKGRVRASDWMTGKIVRKFESPGVKMTNLEIAPNGRFMLGTGKGKEVVVWDLP